MRAGIRNQTNFIKVVVVASRDGLDAVLIAWGNLNIDHFQGIDIAAGCPVRKKKIKGKNIAGVVMKNCERRYPRLMENPQAEEYWVRRLIASCGLEFSKRVKV